MHAGAAAVRTAVCSHDRDRAVALESEHSGDVGSAQCLDLSGKRVEQRSRVHSVRDERGHAPQRRLLIGQQLDILARIHVLARPCQRPGELGEAKVTVVLVRLSHATSLIRSRGGGKGCAWARPY